MVAHSRSTSRRVSDSIYCAMPSSIATMLMVSSVWASSASEQVSSSMKIVAPVRELASMRMCEGSAPLKVWRLEKKPGWSSNGLV